MCLGDYVLLLLKSVEPMFCLFTDNSQNDIFGEMGTNHLVWDRRGYV